MAEVNTAGAVLRRYVPGPGTDEPIVDYDGSGTRTWLYADERGSIIARSNDSGTTIATNAYDEYGIPASGNVGRFGYTGQAWLPEIGLAYYKARMYSPSLGRFMQTDPIGYADGLNWYAYVGGDPINATDPSGLEDDDIIVSVPKNKITAPAPEAHFTNSFGGFFHSSGGSSGPNTDPTPQGPDIEVPDIEVIASKIRRTVSPRKILVSIQIVAEARKRANEICGAGRSIASCTSAIQDYSTIYNAYERQQPFPRASGPGDKYDLKDATAQLEQRIDIALCISELATIETGLGAVQAVYGCLRAFGF